MDQSNIRFSSLSQTGLNAPVSFHSLLGTGPPSNSNTADHEELLTDFDIQTYNEFDVAFGFASNAYPEPPSGPESPSYPHSHDEHTGDESGDLFPSNNASVKSRTMETRKRKPGNRKTGQPQEQILKRRVQNRAAQRSFRERQKEYVHDLENQVDQLKGEINKLHENYQGLLKSVTSAPRMPQWSGDLSPATSLDELELEYSGSVDGSSLEPIKVEGNLWPVNVERDYQGLFYS
jgi:hypothetical protein